MKNLNLDENEIIKAILEFLIKKDYKSTIEALLKDSSLKLEDATSGDVLLRKWKTTTIKNELKENEKENKLEGNVSKQQSLENEKKNNIESANDIFGMNLILISQ